MTEIKDSFNRTFKTLRVSLLNTCNLACVYCCFGNEDSKENYRSGKNQALQTDELLKLIAKLHERLDLSVVRLTGGEPLLYKELPELVRGIRNLGINNLKLTTNGLLLEKMAPALQDAGITSINVSLDAIDPEVYHLMSRRHDLSRTLRGIEAAQRLGIEVKINSVVMKGLNDSQILPLLKYAFERSIRIRFLEIMAMGHLHDTADQHFFSQEEILARIDTNYPAFPLPRKRSSTSNYWQTRDGNIFGIVANESEPFCSDCNRLRLDAYGNIYGCLSSNNPISILETESQNLDSSLREALAQKQSIKFTGSTLSMLHIGG
ncbi:cyclic pyranopterin phosphate synthase [Arcticibacter pallidicorallinus]|uniref:Cyclic pyranopterin phosphate synthase n=1 Tax=Arcticibacter pallidicorallinus TaxID=1259464 RepID=A0A2T0U4J2_9SPHI|nr:radical SAM protein [Arcticibacter pallidicorallinus]PRY52810.1 cyclic pyranopterin phosphate synthase [Arcticibacter pallidicorallinus]